MPKQFGFARIGLFVVTLLVIFSGCRTTTTKLASMPGFGWLNRSEDGWANYEPAPPKPSATAEPTGTSSTAQVASADSPFGKPIEKPVPSKSRFDTERYLPKGKTAPRSGGGDFASAYGTYGPPSKKANASSVQSGPYDTNSKFATNSGSAYVKPGSPSKEDATPFGYASRDPKPAAKQLDTKLPAFEPTYTADSNNRFGAKAESSGYTPPAFPTTNKNPVPAKSGNFANEFTNSFSKVASQTAAAGEKSFNQFGSATNSAIGEAKAFSNDLKNDATQAYNKFAADAKNAVGEFATQSNALSNQAQSTFNNGAAAAKKSFQNVSGNVQNRFSNTTATAQNTFNSAASNVQNSFNNATSSVQQGLGNVAASTQKTFGNSVAEAKNQFNQTANAFSNEASATQAKLSNAATGAVNSAKTKAQNVYNNTIGGAQDVVSGFQNKASGAVQEFQNRLGNTNPPSVAGAINNGFQNTTQELTNGVKNYTQGTVNTIEQNVTSAYQNAKSTVTDYANSTVNGISTGANNLVKNATDSVGQTIQSGTQGLLNTGKDTANQVQTTAQGYAGALSNAAKNIASPASQGGGNYPSTNTPAPYLSPPQLRQGAPGATSPSIYSPGSPSSVPPIQRSPQPFLPGSTNLQGHKVHKQSIQMASAEMEGSPDREPLQLAVGDRYQFPLSLR